MPGRDVVRAEGEYIEMAGGTKLRHGCGKHVNCKEVYVGQWRHDSMHGQGGYRFFCQAEVLFLPENI